MALSEWHFLYIAPHHTELHKPHNIHMAHPFQVVCLTAGGHGWLLLAEQIVQCQAVYLASYDKVIF